MNLCLFKTKTDFLSYNKVSTFLIKVVFCVFMSLFCIEGLYAYTANKVELKMEKYYYRIYITYTDVELKLLKQAYVDYKNYEQASQVYENIKNGADFYIKDSKVIFINDTTSKPW